MNPFKFFTDILHLKSIETIKDEFYSLAYDSNYSQKEEWIETVEFTPDTIGYVERLYFKQYIQDLFAKEKIIAHEALSALLFKETSSVKEAEKRLAIVVSDWISLTDKATSDKSLQKYNLIDFYNEITKELHTKRIELKNLGQAKPYTTNNSSIEKIQWLGNANQLVALFYDLLHESSNFGKAYIQTETPNLAAFIFNNFSAKDGSEIPINTIETGLKISRPEKRPSGTKRLKVEKYSG